MCNKKNSRRSVVRSEAPVRESGPVIWPGIAKHGSPTRCVVEARLYRLLRKE